MSFALNGTHIDGGTFNNVAGNMTQVFNFHVTPSHLLADPRLLDGTTNTSRDHHEMELSNSNSPRVCGNGNPGPSATVDSGVEPPLEIRDFAPPPRTDPRRQRSQPENISNSCSSVCAEMTRLSITSYAESGMDILSRSVVTEALHDSGERFPEPACHPGTRTAVLEELSAWSIDPDLESTILWLHGSAGMGKSAIAQMFAGDCQAQGRLGASFFFRRGHSKRGSWHGLCATIAYQLATSVPELRPPISKAVEADRLIMGRSMTVQFHKLLVEAFSSTRDLELMPVIVLDGLDECEGHRVQQEILRLFIGAIRDHQLPVRLLITSRPEPNIREIFETVETLAICCHLVLSADDSAYRDIRIYLGDEFSRIRREYLTRGVDLGTVWPGPAAVEHLVERSSGIFVYVTTVIRFIDDEYSHPADRLASVLSLDPRSTAPFDDLYTEVLSVVPHEPQQVRILHSIWQSTLRSRGAQLFPEEIDMLLVLHPGTARLALRGLHSVLHVPPICTLSDGEPYIHPLHASLPDYLADVRRSGRWCLWIPWLLSDYLSCTLRLLASPRTNDTITHLQIRCALMLPLLLSQTTPSDTLISLLRNQQVQDSLFSLVVVLRLPPWPQRDSHYPLDLIQLWEEHQLIATLIQYNSSYKREPKSPRRPTLKFDSLYAQMLSLHPDLLFVLKSQVVWSDPLLSILNVMGPPHDFRVFRPFVQLLEVRELLELPFSNDDRFFDGHFPDGDSPADFLRDPHRAGNLYSDPQDIAAGIMLLWIQHAKERLVEGNAEFSLAWLELIERCRSSQRILMALQTLNLAQICDQRHLNPAYPHSIHRYIWPASTLLCVLDWLSKFPDPPLQTITFWERQLAVIRRCTGSQFSDH
ncbi:hypothetical protein FB451DRAFT_182614 [Mycena latifolia]|nr:hypothetical protein FB451DRAFT_182614 [Mycena latifolia]